MSMDITNLKQSSAAAPGVVDISTIYGKAGATSHVHEPAVNTAAVVTLAAPAAGISNVLAVVTWSYDNMPTGGSLTIQDGANTIYKIDITTSGPGFIPFVPPMEGTAATAMTITLAAGGGGVSGIVSVHAWTA